MVSMANCEKQYNFLWALDSSSPHNDDPYFVRRIHHEFEQSLVSFCITLDLTCTSLAGLGSDQTSHSALEDMMRVRSHAANEIYKMMCSSTATNDDVVSKTKKLESLYTSRYVLKYCMEMNEAVAGVRALACIAASAVAGQDMNEAMHQRAGRLLRQQRACEHGRCVLACPAMGQGSRHCQRLFRAPQRGSLLWLCLRFRTQPHAHRVLRARQISRVVRSECYGRHLQRGPPRKPRANL